MAQTSQPDLYRFANSWVAYVAALWALIFALLHAVWAAGWYVGLPADEMRAAFQRPGFLVYDLIIAVLCGLAVLVALALVQPWGRRVPRRWLVALAWAGTGVLVLRAGGSVVQTVYLMARGRFVVNAWTKWEVWFYLGAVLFALSTWRFGRRDGH